MNKLTIVAERELYALVKFREAIFDLFDGLQSIHFEGVIFATQDFIEEYKEKLKEWRTENAN